MVIRTNRFVDDVDLTEETSLTHLLDRYDTDDSLDEAHIIKHSPFYGENEFAKLISNDAGLCIVDLNICNIYSKFDLLKSFIDRVNVSNPISAICLNECWIKEDSDVCMLNLPNYQMFIKRGSRMGHGHCGLIIYVHDQFNAKEIIIDQKSTTWDYMCIELAHYKPNSKKYMLCNVYRLPGFIVDEFQLFVDEFTSFLNVIKNMKHSAFVCGDFNINLLAIGTNKHYSAYFDNILSKGFFPRITLPTRLSEASNYTTNTLIDNILSNKIEESDDTKSGILINDISDHKMIFTYIKNNSYIEKLSKFIEIEKLDKKSLQNFIDELKYLNIYDQLNHGIDCNPQDNYTLFSLLIKYVKEKHLKKKIVKFDKRKHKKSKWMTNGILESINTKDKLYKILVQTDSHNEALFARLKNEFKIYRATLRRSIREAKRLYYIRIFDLYKSDIKKTWSIIKESLNNNSTNKEPITEFVFDNITIKDSDQIANKFNEYFISIGRTLAESITSPHQFSDFLNSEINSRFTFNTVDEHQISEIINKLKNKSSYGHDNISNKLLKHSRDILIKPLTLLINQTLTTGEFPSELKISRVKPLYKSGDVSQFSNYRPISLLPSISKIYERVIFDQILTYFNNHDLLCMQQYGFRPGHSTELAALQLTDHLYKQMDTMKTPMNIYIDLSKAFDTLDHNILLSKLHYYGIRGIEYNLFNNYLHGRHQYVEYNKCKSSTKIMSTGVPQGSILGPLLFLIYINDLPLVSNVFEMLMYADDTTLFCNITNNSNEAQINRALENITEWLASNKLSLNTKKTKFMVFHTHQRKVDYPILKINNNIIERVTRFNFLGLILNSNLNWNDHVDHISKKISKVLGVLYRLKDIYPIAILLNIYNTLIVPHFTYCLIVWGSKVYDGHSLHLLQKKVLRIISNEDYIAHSEPICKNLRLLKITHMYRFTVWKFYFKLMNNLLPSYFVSLKPTMPLINEHYEIRQPKYHLPRIKHEFAEHIISYQLNKLLNEEHVPNLISAKIYTHSFQGFKLYVKNSIIDLYSENCTVVGCHSCNKRLQQIPE